MLKENLCVIFFVELAESENLKKMTCLVGSKFIKTTSKAEAIFLLYLLVEYV